MSHEQQSPFADLPRHAYPISRYIWCHLNWLDPSSEKMTGILRDKVKEKELEELVVVLFAKVEIPRPWRRWICKSQDSRDACITKFTPDPDEYPNRIGPICWEITMIPVPTSGETLRDSIWSLAPGLTTNRQSAQSGNCFLLRSDKLLLILFGFYLRFLNLYSKLSISIFCNSRFNCWAFTRSHLNLLISSFFRVLVIKIIRNYSLHRS